MSVTRPKGFVAAGVDCGIKASGALDLSLIATADGKPVPAAAVFTSNKALAAPVLVTQAHLQATGGRAAAVVLSSGNANAATGAQGRANAEEMCALVAEHLGSGCLADDVLVCSTGLIGIPLPMEPVTAGIPALVAARKGTEEAGALAAQAILTTDTRVKETIVGTGLFTVGGMAKGAAMLAPNLATMLAVLTTDATATPEELAVVLAAGVQDSFNSLVVDGCQSTNDTVILLASGKLGTPPAGALAEAVVMACADLAEQMADDAEGATKVATIRVTGAATADDARRAARRIAESQLVQCSLYGADPYWGRIVSELGSSGAAFDPDRVAIAYGGVIVCRDGIAATHDPAAVKAHLQGRMVDVSADLGLSDGQATFLTTDLTPGYINENMRTS